MEEGLAAHICQNMPTPIRMCPGQDGGILRIAAFRGWLGLRYVLKEDSRATEEIKSRGSLGKKNKPEAMHSHAPM